MKKIILIPDSFKGTMSSFKICSVMKQAINKHYPDCTVISIPVADGGEGSVDAFLACLGGEKIYIEAENPYREPIKAFYGLIKDTAVIEMAAAAGLPLVEDRLNAEKTSTFGVGQLIAHAAENGAKKIIVGLGGSATNDGGAGAAAALGIKFFDKNNMSFVPTGETLCQIESIDTSGLLSVLKDIEIITMCDIDNPLCAENGAAAVFAPQKGADKAMVKRLDKGLYHLAQVIKKDLGKDVLNMQGAGAAGGMGAGMVAFLNSSLQMGIETVLNTVKFDDLLNDTDLVITGEGKIDGQSMRGKVVIGVAHRAKAKGIPVIAVVGDIADDAISAYDHGVSGIFSINRVAVPYKEARLRAISDLYLTVDNMMRTFKLFS